AALLRRHGRPGGRPQPPGPVVFGKLAAAAQHRLAGPGTGIDVQDAQGLVPAGHRHADHLADADAEDALAGAEALVLGGVRDQDALLLADDVVDDGAADLQAFARRLVAAPAHRLGLQLAAVGVAEHDAAAVGLDGAEHQLQDPLEQVVEVEDVADRLA